MGLVVAPFRVNLQSEHRLVGAERPSEASSDATKEKATMEKLKGQIQAVLSEKEISPDEGLVNLINIRIKPPVPVTSDDVYIRAMYLVSDQVNSYGGRFPLDEQKRITELVIDAPVLMGHNKEKLPIGRNFKAELVDREGKSWVKVWFYWLKNSKGAESLQENIDHGIYKECSLGFTFEFPECSICLEDIRICQHLPFKVYLDSSGNQKQAHFNYRKIVKVLETSIVYRGATPDTSFSLDLEVFHKPIERQKSAPVAQKKIEFQPAEVLIAELGEALLSLPNSSPYLVPGGIDLAHLRQTLSKAKELLVSYGQKLIDLVNLQEEYESDIVKMSKAISACKGNQSLSALVERLVSSGNLNFEDLKNLKKQVQEEFNQVFQREPRSRIMQQSDVDVKKIREFKLG